MVDFKKGDRVRVLPGHGMGHYGAKDGMIGVVNENNSDVPYVTLPGIDFDVAFRQVSLEHAPLFAVGDKVRAVESAGVADIGETATVGPRGEWTSEHGSEFVDIIWDGHANGQMDGGYFTSTFEPVAVAASNDNASTASGLTITAGRYYKTRDGRKVGPMRWSMDGNLWATADGFRDDHWYTQHNTHFAGSYINTTTRGTTPDDLIAEWPTTSKTDSGCAAAQVDNLRDEYGPYGAKEGDAKDELSLRITADFTHFHEQIDAAFDRLAKLEEKANSLGIRFQAA